MDTGIKGEEVSPYIILILAYLAGFVFTPIMDRLPRWLIYSVLVVCLVTLVAVSVTTPPSEYAGGDTTRGLVYVVSFWCGINAWDRP